MARMSKPKKAFVLALLLTGFWPAAATPVQPTDKMPQIDHIYQAIMGNWAFQTIRYRNGSCEMNGTLAVLGPSKTDKSAIDCELLAIETCSGLRSRVEQTCRITRTDTYLRIHSTIVNILESKGLSSGYLPDHFSLSEVSSDTMSGYLDSAAIAPVIFQRSTGGIS